MLTIIYHPDSCTLKLVNGGRPKKGQKYAIHTRRSRKHPDQPRTWLVPIISAEHIAVQREAKAKIARAWRNLFNTNKE